MARQHTQQAHIIQSSTRI